MKFSILITMFFLSSCAYVNMLKVKKEETKKLNGDLKYEFVDTMGSFIKLKKTGLDTHRNIIVKSIIYSENKEDTPVEKLISISTPSQKISNIKNYFGSISKLDCEIITGRTHQIRVHLTSSGLPIIGDKNYIFNKEQKFRLNNIPIKVREYLSNFPRQALHSSKLEFIHPISEKLIKITCELPTDMKDLESILK